MNQIITDNRSKIALRCAGCFRALEKYIKAVDAFHQERNRINGLPYIQEEKERMVSVAAATLADNAAAQYSAIKAELEGIHAAATEIDRLLDIGDDLQNTLALVKYGSALPVETRLLLIEPFKGQKQALIILKAAYEAAGLDSGIYFKDAIFDAAVQLDRLDELAYRLIVQPGENMLVVTDFATALEKFAVGMGAELSARFSEMVDLSSVYAAAFRSAVGLGAAD